MERPATIIILSMIFILSCAGNKSKNTSDVNNNITKEKYDILIVYTRQERSKDSNGTEIKISLNDNSLSYYERHWGFKANDKIIKKKIKIDEGFLNYISDFILNELPNKNYNNQIEPDRKKAFNTFSYKLFVNYDEKQYKIDISTKNLNTEDKYYNNLETLFSEMKSKFKLKGKY